MKIFLAGLCALSVMAVTHAAAAADMPIKAPQPTAAPASNWTGFYVGGNAGGAWGNFDPQSVVPFVSGGGAFTTTFVAVLNNLALGQSLKPGGFTGGFESGYNWQSNNLVFGVEGDIGALSLKGNSTANGLFAGVVPQTMTANASTNWLATARSRLGFAADNWLFFATGGAAFTTLKADFGYSDTNFRAETPSPISTTRVGYAVGGGFQAAFWQRWSVKAEYLYVDFGRVSTTAYFSTQPPLASPQPIFNSVDLKASLVRLGLDYRLN